MAATRSARITEHDHRRLQRLTAQSGLKQQDVITRALDVFEREFLLDAISTGFAALQSDPTAWNVELAERAAWDAAGADTGADG